MTDWSGICDKTPQTHGVMQRQPTVCLTMDVKNQGTYCSTQTSFLLLEQVVLPFAITFAIVFSSCDPNETFPVFVEKFEQSFGLFVQFAFKPVIIKFVPFTTNEISLVKSDSKIPFMVVLPTTVVPSALRYSLFGLSTQSICSDEPPVAQLAEVQAIRLAPSATIAL